MSSGGLTSVVLILFIFSLIHIFLISIIGIAQVEKDWDNYKCNPLIIPSASIFGKDPIETGKDCIKSNQFDFMGDFLKPIYNSIIHLAENGSLFNDVFSDIKLFGKNMEYENQNYFEQIGSWFKIMGTEVRGTFINFENLFSSFIPILSNFGKSLKNVAQVGIESSHELPKTIIDIFT